MLRRRMVGLLWPLTIWALVFGWRAVGCKSKAAAGKGADRSAAAAAAHYPKPPPSATWPPHFTPVGQLGE